MSITSTPVLPSLIDRFQEIVTLQSTEPQNAISQFEELILQCVTEEKFEIAIKGHLQISKIYNEQGFAYKALRSSGTALQISNHHVPDNNNILALCYKELGVIYADGLKKYSIALDYFFKALKCNIPSLKVSLYNNIGSVYKDAGHFEEATKYLKLGYAIVENTDSYFNIFILENLGRVYLLQHKFILAEEALLKALEHSSMLINSSKIDTSIYYIRGYVLNTLGELYLKTKRSEEAIPLIDEALAKSLEHNHLAVVLETLKNRSTYALQKDDEELFLITINRAIEYTEKENLINEGESCLKLLKDYHWSHGNYREACIIADKIIEHKAKAKEMDESNSIADVLEQRQSEIVLLEEDNRMINRQKEDLQQFAYIVAHDLKEPLRSIGSYSSLIKRRYASSIDEDGREFLSFIVNSSSHMYKMLEDLLKYVTLNEQDNAIEMVDPSIILDNISYRLKDKVKDTSASIMYNDLPKVFIRQTHLGVLLENLIKNAIKFRSSDRLPVITITAEEQEEHIRFAVKDNGKGISPQFYQNIFQIFKRLEKANYEGTGIGLSICKKIVESYHGKIWVESVVDEGTTFFFTVRKETT